MALINCPECGKQVSNVAVACPNCGHPLSPPTLEDRTVVRDVAPAVVERDEFPKWIFIPLGVLGLVLIVLLFMLFRQEEDDTQRNINVDISAKRPASNISNSVNRSGTEPNQITVPPETADTNISTLPQNAPPATDTTVSEIPASVENASGTLDIEAKISDRTGGTRPVRAEKFYLLDEDLETILKDAGLEPIEGQSLRNSLGLAVVYPDRYGDFRKKALDEINKHVKYDVTTDASGKARMQNIKPDTYHLFAVTKTATGFAIWSSEIAIKPGQNILNLTPQPMTETKEEE
jgi:hypothetical protein